MSITKPFKFNISNTGIYVIRHGARTSKNVGRHNDHELSRLRKGLTIYGYSQSYLKGQNFFKENLKKSKQKSK